MYIKNEFEREKKRMKIKIREKDELNECQLIYHPDVGVTNYLTHQYLF